MVNEDQDLEKTTLCLHQIFRLEQMPNIKREGWGDCYLCMPDDKNKQCKGYCPVNFMYVNVSPASQQENLRYILPPKPEHQEQTQHQQLR